MAKQVFLSESGRLQTDDGDVPAAAFDLSDDFQPLDSDLTAIAALSTTAFGRSLLELASAAALAGAHDHDGTYQGLASAFEVTAVSASVSQVSWNTFTQSSGYFLGGYRLSAGNQNAEVVFDLGRTLQGGTWSFALLHAVDSNRGIYTVAASTDGSAWTDLGTIDGYAAANATTRTLATGWTMPNLTRFVRLTMATKNASASDYYGSVSGFSGVRTGA